MQDSKNNILVWLPGPMGDAVLCTPALRAIRRHFKSSKITFLAQPVVRQVLSPCLFNDAWLESRGNPIAMASQLKAGNFTHAILLKNSFASALAVRLARIPNRVGYARQGRGLMLTEKLYPPKLPNGKYKPRSMVDYYLDIAVHLGAETDDRCLDLQIDQGSSRSLDVKLPELGNSAGRIIVMVPGGAFGPSKCWPAENFARTADRLIDKYEATVLLSVAPDPTEKQIAKEICALSKRKLVSLAEHPLNLGELKALYALADLVITNDTGPRHIAIALKRKLITLFGPNDPAWTETGYENEIQIVGNVPCAPCAKPRCGESEHFCMKSVTVEMVCDAAQELLADSRSRAKIFALPWLKEISDSFSVDPDYESALAELGLTSIDDVFCFEKAESLTKNNLAAFRSRLQFEIRLPQSQANTTVFLKRYDKPPILTQLKNWISHRRRKSCASCEFEPMHRLPLAGIATPKAVAYGEQWNGIFEKRSFIVTEKISDAEALERRLPHCFEAPRSPQNLKMRRKFIEQLAGFVRRFHQTGCRHRDLYLSHIFCSDDGTLHLIDLARVFKPVVLRRRFQIKDIAQIHYSAPAEFFSASDRLRFYIGYTGRKRLTTKDKAFIRKALAKANRMAAHDRKHGRGVPFAG